MSAPVASHLLEPPGATLREDLARTLAAIRDVFPLKTAHRKELPQAVQGLSHLLTSERGQSRGYWQKPAFTGAYLYYFLPWNLVRLAWLLPQLDLNLAGEDRIMDLGSGPLTLPLGLWLARRELRLSPLEFVCADTAQRPMELGRKTLEKLAGPNSPWQVELLRAPLDAALRKAGRVKLITAVNVLNEMQTRREALEESLENIFYSMDRYLEPGGGIFLMEPGTRLGGKLVALLRQIALENGYTIKMPCTHAAACPYAPPAEDWKIPVRQDARSRVSGWCHFSLGAASAPDELVVLSREAELEKERLSFSCLLLRKPDGKTPPKLREKRSQGGVITPVRVISDKIRIPGGGTARYVCSGHGPGLLCPAAEYRSGMLVEALLADAAGRDPKSGAWIMCPAGRDNMAQADERRKQTLRRPQYTDQEKLSEKAKKSRKRQAAASKFE